MEERSDRKTVSLLVWCSMADHGWRMVDAPECSPAGGLSWSKLISMALVADRPPVDRTGAASAAPLFPYPIFPARCTVTPHDGVGG
ncbi:hypothetical protein HRbin28_01818 [bacterium HR28]|jgi:hypothetical protein|nr:hypothetical protein HRbin28_01818 [bacterium HR28]